MSDKRVPREPTQQMLAAAGMHMCAKVIYQAMVDAAPATPSAEPRREVCWLIERGQQDGQVPTLWWCRPGKGDYKYGRRWTEDANKAHRFASFSAAIRPYDEGGLDTVDDAPVNGDGDLLSCRATEHVFFSPSAEPPADELVSALRAYQQADEDGVMVLVSRQACDEAADALERQRERIATLEAQHEDDIAHCNDHDHLAYKLANAERALDQCRRLLKEQCDGVTSLRAKLAEARRGASDSRVLFYEREFYPLSNFSAFRLKWQGHDFDTSEAAYHWEKFPDHIGLRDAVRLAPSAHEAFKVAERAKYYRRSDWDAVKIAIMRDILRAKAEQHEYVRRKLLQTGERELIEDSWRDDFWGWGPNRDGQNMLGKLWMEVRAELRAALAAEGKQT